MRRETALLGLVLTAGCAVRAPADPYVPADRAVRSGNLLRALAHLDEVPPSHPRYAEARTLALAVERRMRRSQEMVVQGLTMRAEWQDEEAIHFFERALQIWPQMIGVEELLNATKNRMASLQPSTEEESSGAVATTEPLTEAETTPATPEGAPVAKPEGGESNERVRTLRKVHNLLEKGGMEEALDLLERLHAKDSADREVGRTLARVLHQRALLQYGQGWLEPAVADWSRVLSIIPDHAQAKAFLAASEAEMEERGRKDQDW